jgi:8-oxo-dGTP pyrophosphatase MutT (NUDIX family)
VNGERTVYESPYVHLRLVEVAPPGHEPFEHHVVHIPRHATGVVVADARRGGLMLWRHRFMTDNWGWEVPAGAIEPGEDPATAAAREVLEETGWQPGPLRNVLTYDVAHGITDHQFYVFFADGAEPVGDPVDVIEADRVEWVPFDEIPRLIASGGVIDGPTLTGLFAAAARRWIPAILLGPSPESAPTLPG